MGAQIAKQSHERTQQSTCLSLRLLLFKWMIHEFTMQGRMVFFFFVFLTHLGLSYIPIPQKAPTVPRSFSCYVLLGLLFLDRRRGEQRKWQIRFKEVQKPHKMFTNCMLVFTVVVVHVYMKRQRGVIFALVNGAGSLIWVCKHLNTAAPPPAQFTLNTSRGPHLGQCSEFITGSLWCHNVLEVEMCKHTPKVWTHWTKRQLRKKGVMSSFEGR